MAGKRARRIRDRQAVILRRQGAGLDLKALIRLCRSDIGLQRDDIPRGNRGPLWIRWASLEDIPQNEPYEEINMAEAIRTVSDKAQFRLTLQEHNPELVPRTIVSLDDAEFADYPLVVRPQRHSKGRDLYVANNYEELEAHSNRCGRGWYASRLIPKEREFRVFVASGRCFTVAEKIPGNPEAVGWNFDLGGRFEYVNRDGWPLQAVRKSIEAFNLSGLDFGAVDVVVAEGNAYVIEINSAPALTSDYHRDCMSKVLDYFINHGTDQIPLIKERGGYLKFIHPAVCEKARLT